MADNPKSWMWSEALEMLAQAERLHHELFQPRAGAGRQPSWAPPVDVIETDREVMVLAALPGVDPEQVEAAIDQGALVITGQRILPASLRRAIIHRMELPQGRFRRRVPLPPGPYGSVQLSMVNGCLFINLEKA